MSAKKPKVMLVGIDAADPDYIDRRIAEGGLPNLKKFRDEGAWGRMRSTFPVLSSAAWSTIATGLPPEKHGIFEFFRRTPGTWTDEIVHGGLKKGENFWEIAAKNGHKAVVINMPMTYPPRSHAGEIVVAGMDTPGENTAFVAPAEEKAPLLAEVPNYRIELTAAQFRTVEDFLEAVSQTMEARLQAARYLFDRHQPELAVVIFTALDRVLHALWKYMDPDHPAYHREEAPAWRAKVDALYDQVDNHLGELIEWAGEECRVFTCSDHGGAAVHGVFYLNRWLAQHGYLYLKKSGPSLLKVVGTAQQWVKHAVPRSIKNLGNKLFPNAYANVETIHGLSRLDTMRTKVYAWRKTDVMRVNLAGREPGGLVRPGKEFNGLLKEVKGKLEKVVDPRTSHAPIRKVWTREEAYPLSSDLDDCPDLVIEWNGKLYEVSTSLDNLDGPLFTSEEKPDRPWREEINGNHALYGIFGAIGKGIVEGKVYDSVDIQSVAPSVLAGLGITETGEMTGEVPEGMFTDSSIADSPKAKSSENEDSSEEDSASDVSNTSTSGTGDAKGTDDSQTSTTDEEVYTDEEKALLEKRLRDLGYM